MEGHHTTLKQTTNVGKEITQFVKIDSSTLAGMVFTTQKQLMDLLPPKYSPHITLHLHLSSIIFATLHLDMATRFLSIRVIHDKCSSSYMTIFIEITNIKHMNQKSTEDHFVL